MIFIKLSDISQCYVKVKHQTKCHDPQGPLAPCNTGEKLLVSCTMANGNY